MCKRKDPLFFFYCKNKSFEEVISTLQNLISLLFQKISFADLVVVDSELLNNGLDRLSVNLGLGVLTTVFRCVQLNFHKLSTPRTQNRVFL